MEWQNEQIRFSSNSGVFGVGFGNRDKGGVLMAVIHLTEVTIDLTDSHQVTEFTSVTDDEHGYLVSIGDACDEVNLLMRETLAIDLLHKLAEKLDYKLIPLDEIELKAKIEERKQTEQTRCEKSINDYLGWC